MIRSTISLMLWFTAHQIARLAGHVDRNEIEADLIGPDDATDLQMACKSPERQFIGGKWVQMWPEYFDEVK
jgi:hypothetical protein